MMQAIFHALLVLMSAVALFNLFRALPIKRSKSAQQRRVEKQLPTTVVVFLAIAFVSLLYGFVSDARASYELGYGDVQARLHPADADGPRRSGASSVSFDPLRELRSTFSFAAPTSGIDCSHVRILDGSTYEVEGTIFVGGLSITNSVIPRGAVRVGDRDVGELIGEKCAAGTAFQNALQDRTPSR